MNYELHCMLTNQLHVLPRELRNHSPEVCESCCEQQFCRLSEGSCFYFLSLRKFLSDCFFLQHWQLVHSFSMSPFWLTLLEENPSVFINPLNIIGLWITWILNAVQGRHRLCEHIWKTEALGALYVTGFHEDKLILNVVVYAPTKSKKTRY